MGFVEPRIVATHFHIRAGERVADFGAGSGHYLASLSRMVGSNGKVFAVEIQRGLAEKLSDTVQTQRLSNVQVIWGDIEQQGGTKIAEGSLDAVLLSNTFSLIEDRPATLKECFRALRKGGKLIVIDWTDSFGGMGPSADMVVSETSLRTLLADSGFTHERTFPAGEHHYGSVFRKT